MPTHVYANNNEVASKAADGKSIAAFPDVCFSPPAPPVGPMPLPYPNTGEVKDTDSGTAKVFVKDKMSGMGDDSHMTKSMGDDAATKNFNKGMITGALQGKCYFGLWSMDVQMEGKGVPRHLDMVTHNQSSANIFNTLNVNISKAATGVKTDTISDEFNSAQEYDEQIKIIDEDGQPVSGIPYYIKDDDENIYEGYTDTEGYVPRIFTKRPQQLRIHIGILALEQKGK